MHIVMHKLTLIADRVSSSLSMSENNSCPPFVTINFVIQSLASHLPVIQVAPATP